MMQGICPVCGTVNTVYNPCLSMFTNQIEAAKNEDLKKKFPWSVFRCYHNGTTFHNKENFTASAGTLYPMHLFILHDSDNQYHRYHPLANDDCNKRHWKI